MARRSPAGRSTTSPTRSCKRRSSCSVLPFIGLDIDTSQFEGAGPDRRLLAAIAVALAASAVLLLAVPKVRARVLPGVRDALSGLWSVARVRRKRLEVFGGSIASELLYSVALGATCLAYGVHLNLGQLIFINTSASVLSGVVPVPEASELPRRPLSRSHRDGGRPVDCLRDRNYAAPLHLLPAPDLGLLLASMARWEGLPLTCPHQTPRGRLPWRPK